MKRQITGNLFYNANRKHALLLAIAVLGLWVVTPALRAQTVTLSAHKKTLKSLLEKMEKQSGCHFTYLDSEFPSESDISVKVVNQPLEKVLDGLLPSRKLTYIRTGNNFAIKRKSTDETTDAGTALLEAVRGSVKDEKGDPLPGVSVSVKGAYGGVMTNENGTYSIQAPKNGALQFSFIGMQTRVVGVKGQAVLNVTLLDASSSINEVVVVGYGSMNKRDVTTSIAGIQGKDFKDMPVGNFDQALVGRLSGVQVLQNSGKPNAGTDIRVRGTGSITAGIEPLYVVDGVPLDRASGALAIPCQKHILLD